MEEAKPAAAKRKADDDEEEEAEEEEPVIKKKQRLDVNGAAAATNGGAAAGESVTVFVGNLSWSASEDDIKKHFKDCGKIVSVRIGMDAATGRSKGYAHVDFESADQAQKATSKAGSELGGRNIKVEVAQARAPRESYGAAGNGGGDEEGTTVFIKGFDVNFGSEDDVCGGGGGAVGARIT